ncbi:hypothetical protein QQP08_026373 [Theobroma cacao]|nr:hypothetical protein QQP08_026373 [Theobroma cacao]
MEFQIYIFGFGICNTEDRLNNDLRKATACGMQLTNCDVDVTSDVIEVWFERDQIVLLSTGKRWRSFRN